MNYEAVRQAAFEAWQTGISVVPPSQDGSKRPFPPTWKSYQSRRPTLSEMEAWYSQPRTGVGWVLGAVSAPPGLMLEGLDFDDRSVYAEFKSVVEASGLGPVLDRVERGYFEHSPNGCHLLYYHDIVVGNLKLAKSSPTKTTIETRGDGGYLVVAPTFGSVNVGGVYTLKSGSAKTIATLTREERMALHSVARTFDCCPKITLANAPRASGEGRPGDDYAQRATWAEILEPHGWRQVYTRLGVVAWRRPGKDGGISATTNYADSDLLYVFSTSTVFEAERGYSKFSAYALLNHHSDYSAAAQELSLLGYGQDPIEDAPSDSVDLTAFLQSLEHPQDPDCFPADLLRVPGLVGDLAQYINDTSVCPQPILSLGASIAAVGTLIGRQVRLESNLRSNIYIVGVAETGAGKEHARQAIRLVFDTAGLSEMCAVSGIASGAAIYVALSRSPACLFLLDEIGRTIQAIGDRRAPRHLTSQVDAYLKIYGESSSRSVSDDNADPNKRIVIQQPCLCIYGTTVPGRLYDGLHVDQMTDGFLARLLIFESETHDPKPRNIAFTPPPEPLVDGFAQWKVENPGNVADIYPPVGVVFESMAAKRVYDRCNEEIQDQRKAHRQQGVAGMYSRTWSTARKLGLIRACGIRRNQPEVTESDAEWGVKLSRWITDHMVRRILEMVSESAVEKDRKRVLRLIRRGGRDGMSLATICTQTGWLSRTTRLSILVELQEGGAIKELKKHIGNSRKLSRVYYATEYAPQNEGQS